MTLADKEKAYLWFISFVYRLRNALFHEIIDPLNDEWQVIFKNSYHVLKQVVDQNIWRLKQLKLLPSASQAAAEEDYNREPPPDIDWPTDEEAKFTWFYYEMLKLNKDGARVLLKGKIDFAEHHYETECTVMWNESLSDNSIKNVVPNNLDVILKNAKIEKIYVNGNQALNLYNKYLLPHLSVEGILLPSTSPANAIYSFEKLCAIWQAKLKVEND